MPEAKPHKRINDILLGPLERPALQWLAAHMPSWMTPDKLTAIGIAGAVIILVGYILSNEHPAFLWLATFGYVINWFGDSLDGTLARFRKIERPKYGFFVDHTVDAFSQMLIFGGLGLSPYVSFNIAAMALVGYLLITVYIYVDTYVTGLFKISYGKFGPTEMRMIAILANTLFFFVGKPLIELSFATISVFDILVAFIAAALITIFIFTVIGRARELAQLEERGRSHSE